MRKLPATCFRVEGQEGERQVSSSRGPSPLSSSCSSSTYAEAAGQGHGLGALMEGVAGLPVSGTWCKHLLYGCRSTSCFATWICLVATLSLYEN